jgi:hypothetical protein
MPRVQSLAPAQHEVGAFFPDRRREGSGRADRVGQREDAVREMDRTVGSERQGLAERLLRLRRSHGHHHDLVGEPPRVLDGVTVVGVQLERHSFALERLRVLVELDRA